MHAPIKRSSADQALISSLEGRIKHLEIEVYRLQMAEKELEEIKTLFKKLVN